MFPESPFSVSELDVPGTFSDPGAAHALRSGFSDLLRLWDSGAWENSASVP